MSGFGRIGKIVLAAVFMAGVLHPGEAGARSWIRADTAQQVKGCVVVLYADPDFRGPRWRTTNSWAGIGWEFGNKISSMKIHSGVWQFFRNEHFDSQIGTLFPGKYKQLTPTLDNAISSFRCVRAT